jgi:hypothetical protein
VRILWSALYAVLINRAHRGPMPMPRARAPWPAIGCPLVPPGHAPEIPSWCVVARLLAGLGFFRAGRAAQSGRRRRMYARPCCV